MEQKQKATMPLPVLKIVASKHYDGTLHTSKKEKLELETEPQNKQAFFTFLETQINEIKGDKENDEIAKTEE